MRLVCPNCGAQYNVDDGAIPESGRDVQCSSCGHGWFQQPAGAGEEGRSAATRIASRPGPKHETTRLATGTPGQAPREDGAAQPAERTGRRALDTAVMDVLREEAEREKAARAAEIPPEPKPAAYPEPERAPEPTPEAAATAPEAAPRPPEPQPAPKPEDRQVETETHKARMRGENPVVAVAALSGRAVQRKEMLPDIEQINSTLRASADPSRAAEEAGDAEAEKRKAKRGFRMGFGLVAVIALAATLLYTQGAQIAANVPALSGPITSYVAAVNSGRRWLDTTLRGAGGE